MTVTVTSQMLRAAKTPQGGYRYKQVEMARQLTDDGSRPMGKLVGKTVDLEWWDTFCSLATKPVKSCLNAQKKADRKERKRKKKEDARKRRETLINAFSVDYGGWEWKPKPQDVPRPKVASSIGGKNQGIRQAKRDKVSRTPDKEFYISPEWRTLRVRVLSKYDCKCMMCGRSPKDYGIVIHVDHIKPRSKYPDLALCFENLQLLCEDCNIGKSNKYETDYRPDIMPELDWDLLENMPTTMQ